MIIYAIEIQTVSPSDPAYQPVLSLRRRVLRWPLGLELTDEEVLTELDQVHFVGLIEGEVVACALMRVDDGVPKMRQVAVDPDRQGQGLGRELVKAFEAEAAKRGYQQIVLNARETAVPFYLRLGYEVVGEPFEEVTIPHRKMRKALGD